jgi:hypothetical protein
MVRGLQEDVLTFVLGEERIACRSLELNGAFENNSVDICFIHESPTRV